jgi:hypothetical protein
LVQAFLVVVCVVDVPNFVYPSGAAGGAEFVVSRCFEALIAFPGIADCCPILLFGLGERGERWGTFEFIALLLKRALDELDDRINDRGREHDCN